MRCQILVLLLLLLLQWLGCACTPCGRHRLRRRCKARACHADARARRGAVWDAQQAVATRRGAVVIDPVPLLCSPTCAPLVDGTWRWYQRDQLTNAGSAVLTPAVLDALRRVTGG